MTRRYIYLFTSLLGFFGWIVFGTAILKQSGASFPTRADRPEYVPDSAMFCRIGEIWIDVQQDPIGAANHFYLTMYDPDTAAVTLRKAFSKNPEILGQGRYELEYGSANVSSLRRMIYLYDGYEVYLKDGRALYQNLN
ncbi:hypothetical protein JYT16_02345 [Gemmatimonas aurantiaca]|nr:hypothetical protein [Gemmatimonas aurantiaca]